MAQFEYKVVPAPKKGTKSWGRKSSEERFATALSNVINEMAADGWEYQRSDTLPSEEKSGFRAKTTVFQNMLIFRRSTEAAVVAAPRQEESALPREPKIARPVAVQPQPANEPRVARPAPEPTEPVAETEAEVPAKTEGGAPKLPVFMRGDRGNKPDVAAE